MASVSRKGFRAITALVVVCMLQVYVLADATRPISPQNIAPNNSALSGLILGRLTIPANQPILVNGNSANSGTTIFSGSQLQTPEGIEASVQLGPAGKLFLQPNTNLTVTFDKESIDVKVAAGKAFVTPNLGVKSSITTPDGKTTTSVGSAAGPEAPRPGYGDWSNEAKTVFWIVIIGGTVFTIWCIVKCGNDSP
jgi:hypothetical protein